MKITDMKCTVLGQNPIVRIMTDEGISGFGQVEASKHYLRPHVNHYRGSHPRPGPDRCQPRHAQHPQAWRVQAVGQRRQRDRDGAVGHRRQGRRACRSTNCSAARCATGCASITAACAFPMTGYDPQDYAENMQQDEGRQRRLHHRQAGHRLPQPDEVRGARLLLRRDLPAARSMAPRAAAC